MASVAFDYSLWTERYPEMAGVSQALATLYFGEATLTLDNGDCSQVTDLGQRLTLLNMLTAHIAALNGAGEAPSGLVGRVSRATEGSVTVETDMGKFSSAEAYYLQTQYGAAYWNATRSYRTMHYRPGPDPTFEPFPFGRAAWLR